MIFRYKTTAALLLLAAAPDTFASKMPEQTTVIDFNDLRSGTVVHSLLDIQVSTQRRIGRHFRRSTTTFVNGEAMIFDSQNPTGGDVDLGTPHQSFGGGPGIGRGGRAGARFPNDKARGNVLIVSEDGNAADPDDNQYGGIITFDFASPRRVDSFGLLVSDVVERPLGFAHSPNPRHTDNKRIQKRV